MSELATIFSIRYPTHRLVERERSDLYYDKLVAIDTLDDFISARYVILYQESLHNLYRLYDEQNDFRVIKLNTDLVAGRSSIAELQGIWKFLVGNSHE